MHMLTIHGPIMLAPSSVVIIKFAVAGEKMRRCRCCADREILRRALAPPVRRFSQPRWLNLQPTPSHLCYVSMA
uniref:Uncharacterized protein n=1 Tax=Nelumbo nucifera TaxID=4432 RepID=A0A822Y808_NELNU|nr:TPA_asm: hypothetical protein HUJ06_027195 [Nelumbo nucifera]